MPRHDSTATLKERAYSRLRRMIETGELPRGTRISNRKIAKLLGMSAIPVREAITQMAGEGLLEHRPGIGTYVMNPTRIEIDDIYELREVLESFAARRAAQVSGERGLFEMRQSVMLMRKIKDQADRSDDPDTRRQLGEQCGVVDASFHMAVLQRAGNQVALRTVTGLRLISRVFSQRPPADRLLRLEKVIKEHTEVLEAIEQGDAKLAGRLMRHHIHDGRTLALQHHDLRRRDEAGASYVTSDLLDDLSRQIEQLEHRP